MARPTNAAGFARALMDLAVMKGAERAVLAERSRIDPNELLDQDNRVPLEKYVSLMRAGKELTGDPALALHFGEAFDMAELSIVGLLGGACETAVDAFAQLNRYSRLVIDVDGVATGDRFVLSRIGGQLWLNDARTEPNDFPELTESTFARMVCSARRFGVTQFVTAAHVTHGAPAYRAEYERIFQIPITFDSDRNALQMSEDSWTAFKPAYPSRYVFGVFSERAEKLLKSLESSTTTRGRVESLLMPALHTGGASVDMIAGQLGVSRQTLFRKLKAEGVTFEKVLDELRHQLALHYLGDGRVSVNETAYLVGFSDRTAFSRAFKRWTGSRPRARRGPEVK